jgi:hypothetical protein
MSGSLELSEIGLHFVNPSDVNVGRKIRVQGVTHYFGAQMIEAGIEGYDLSVTVDTGVGPSGTLSHDPVFVDPLERIIEGTLNRPHFRLVLETEKIRPVVGDNSSKSLHN